METLSERNPVAYFSVEYGLGDQLPIYAGGLGILAGDFLRGANDLNLPVVGLGLFYKRGYFRQLVTSNGQQSEYYPEINPRKAGLKECCTFEIPIGGCESKIRVWKCEVGKVKLYLLEAAAITDRLYSPDLEKRIQQEIVLGIGGSQFLEIAKIEPGVYHMNEGHAAFAIVDIVRKFMQKERLNFMQALEKAHHSMVFTNHTLLPGGTDLFPRRLIEKYLSPFVSQLGVSVNEFLNLGASKEEERFSETLFALRVSCQTNTVSQAHKEAAAKIWPSFKVKVVTNAVHFPTWVSPRIRRSQDLWQAHCEEKESLCRYLAAKQIFADPEKLTITWARRFTEYKRPLLIFSDPDRLRAILNNRDYPVQIIFAGKAHPADEEGKYLIQKIVEYSRSKEFSTSVFFIPDYNIEMAKYLVRGSDVWLNTPRRGWEACGTSGMKAAANGVLQWTVTDGWAAEVDWTGKGWIVEDDSNSLYGALENEIVPCFYTRNAKGIPVKWVERSQKVMKEVQAKFNVERMIREYTQKLYQPALEMSLAAEKYAV